MLLNCFPSLFFSASSLRNLIRQSKQAFLRSLSSTSSTQTRKPPWNVIFFGTDHYSLYALEPLLNLIQLQHPNSKCVQNFGICSSFSDPMCDVAHFIKTLSHTRGLGCVDYDPRWTPKGWDLGVVASFGQLIPEEIIRAFPYGILCIHPSILPRWRGAAPIPRTILNGDRQCGVSLFSIHPEKFDVGPIIAQNVTPVPENATSRSLGRVLMGVGVDLLWTILGDLQSSLAHARPQFDAETKGGIAVTYAKKVKPSELFVDWNSDTAYLDRFYRALHEDFDIKTQWGDMVLKISGFADPEETKGARVDSLIQSSVIAPGTLFFHKKREILFAKCADGWVGVANIGIPGRRPMTAKDFYNGFLSKDKKDSNMVCFTMPSKDSLRTLPRHKS